MNARQKAKKYKQLYEQLKNTSIKEKIIRTEYPIVHLRCSQIVCDDYCSLFNEDKEITDGINRFFYKWFADKVIEFIKVVGEEDVIGGKRLTGDLWVVDRRCDVINETPQRIFNSRR